MPPTGGPAQKEDPAKKLVEHTKEMSILMQKLRKQAQTPQEIYLDALEEFAEEDKEDWATHFPPGYRERIAPQLLGEIYSTGKTA